VFFQIGRIEEYWKESSERRFMISFTTIQIMYGFRTDDYGLKENIINDDGNKLVNNQLNSLSKTSRTFFANPSMVKGL